jgi:hypothetical protein
MTSVRFLDQLGIMDIDSSNFGIDSDGRLHPFRQGSRSWRPADYREVFCDMISRVKKKLEQREPTQKIRALLKAVDYFGGDIRDEEHLPKVTQFQDCAKAMLEERSFDMHKLESLFAACMPAVKELDEVISFVNGVRQDLVETGSTSLSKWAKLKGMTWVVSLDMGRMDPDHIGQLTQDIAEQLSPYMRLLGQALTLKYEIEVVFDGDGHFD